MYSLDKKGHPWWEVFLLWAGVAVSVSEIWSGSLIAPAGLFAGIFIILVGHVLGGLVLSGAGRIGTRYKAYAMQSVQLVLGRRGAAVPAILNVLQLVGWASIMLALSGDIGATVGSGSGSILSSRIFWIFLIGAGTLGWSFFVNSKYHKIVHAIVITGILILSVIMTWLALNPSYYQLPKQNWISLSAGEFMGYTDLVIALPISWVPLIADYSRMARSEKGAFHGSFWGYFIVSSWMFFIGLVVSLATGSQDPAMNILQMMGKLGLMVPAMLLVFSSTMTSDFPDIYSSACSLFSINPKIRKEWSMWGTGILTIILALFFDLSRFEDFLIFIGAFFVPLFAILLTDYFILRKQDLSEIDFDTAKGLGFTKGFRISGIIAWILGIAVFFIAASTGFVLGGSITSFLISILAFLIFTRILEK